jgi:hypothetical protein
MLVCVPMCLSSNMINMIGKRVLDHVLRTRVPKNIYRGGLLCTFLLKVSSRPVWCFCVGLKAAWQKLLFSLCYDSALHALVHVSGFHFHQCMWAFSSTHLTARASVCLCVCMRLRFSTRLDCKSLCLDVHEPLSRFACKHLYVYVRDITLQEAFMQTCVCYSPTLACKRL